jgi:hypothetical protein
MGTGRLVRVWVRGRGRVRYGTGTIHGYGRYGTCVRYVGTVFVPMYRTDRTHVSYSYRPHIVPVPYPRPYPHPNPYQPSRTYHLAYRPTSKNATRALRLKLAKFVLFNLKCFWESLTTMDFAHKIGEFGLLGCCRDNIVEYTIFK